MEFTTTEFNPDDQGQVLDLSSLLSGDAPAEESISLSFDEQPATEETPAAQENTEEANVPPAAEETKPAVATSFYKAFVQKKIESGEWFDIEDFDQLEVDEDTFNEILQAQSSKQVEDAKVNTVKTDTLSPLMVKALEIDKNGGNISQVFETYKNIYENPENPIGSLDLDNPTDQESIIRYYNRGKGLEDFEINSIIEGHKKNLTLDKAAGKAKQDIDTVFNNYLETQAKETENLKLQRLEALKTYKTSVSDELKKYQLNDSYRKTLVDKVAKVDDKGVYAIDAAYDEWRRNPEKVVKLAMFLTNEEEYVKNVAAKVINREKEDTFTKIKLSNKVKGGEQIDYNSSNREEKVLSLEGL